MATLMVALRWDGNRLSKQELMVKAQKAVQKVDSRFNHLDHLDIQAMPDENGQFVQLIVQTNAGEADCQRMQKMLKEEFEGNKPWWKFW